MASQIKILAHSPSGSLAYKTGSKSLVYMVRESPADPPPETPEGPSGRWFYYVVWHGFNNFVIYGAGVHETGFFNSLLQQNVWFYGDGAEEGGTRWADLRLTVDGSLTNPAVPPTLYVSDGLPGYSENTMKYPVSFFGGSASTQNGTITMMIFWSGTLMWVP